MSPTSSRPAFGRLSPMRKAFVTACVRQGPGKVRNGTAAATVAGYKEPRVAASRLLNDNKVRAALDELMAEAGLGPDQAVDYLRTGLEKCLELIQTPLQVTEATGDTKNEPLNVHTEREDRRRLVELGLKGLRDLLPFERPQKIEVDERRTVTVAELIERARGKDG